MSSVPRTKKVYPWERLINEEARKRSGNVENSANTGSGIRAVKRSRNLENSAMNMNVNTVSSVRTTKRTRNNNNNTAESKTPPRTVKKPRINIPLRTAAQGASAKRKENEARAAASAKRKENEARAAASAKRKAIADRIASAKRKQIADRIALNKKRKANEARAAASAKRKANEARAAASAKRKANEARAAASAKRKENEARAAASAKRKENEARAAASAKRKENEARAAASAKRKENEARAAASAKRKENENANRKAKKNANTNRLVEADAERISQMFRKNTKIPKTKKSYIPILTKIINNTNLPKNREELKDFLKFIYIEKSTDANTQKLFHGKSIKEAVRIIWKHYRLFHNKSRGGDILGLIIPLDTQIITEFAYLMYMDMKHDKTIGEMTFNRFIKSDIVKTFFGSDYTKIDANVKSELLNKLRNLPSAGFESAIKNELHTYFKTGDSISLNNKQINQDIFKGTDLCLLFDQEDEGITLSNARKRFEYSYSTVMHKFIEMGRTAESSVSKPFYNTVSIANLVDPGHDMQIDSAKKDSEFFMKENPTTFLSWNYRKPIFKIGNTILTYTWDDNKNNFSIDIITDKGSTNVPAGITKNKAIEMGTTRAILSKFLGDFMQVLTTTALNKTNTKSKYTYVLGTGDTMCAAIYSYICDISNTDNKLWFVLSKEQKSKLYGMNSVINTSQLGNNRINLQARSRTTMF